MIDRAAVAANVELVRERIERAARGRSVRLVAVTKGFGVDAIEAARSAGIDDIGENYAQELERKVSEIGPLQPRWHFIGRVQRNKVRRLASTVSLWQSVDRVDVAREIARWHPGASVLVQVNVSDEPQKAGCPPGDTATLVAASRAVGLDVQGLMTIGRLGSPEDARPGFRLLAELADALELGERSMGMSDDFDIAVEEGATIVRVGRSLFGPRP